LPNIVWDRRTGALYLFRFHARSCRWDSENLGNVVKPVAALAELAFHAVRSLWKSVPA
jgi:hypothetical protein